jgi:hypothetical protein
MSIKDANSSSDLDFNWKILTNCMVFWTKIQTWLLINPDFVACNTFYSVLCMSKKYSEMTVSLHENRICQNLEKVCLVVWHIGILWLYFCIEICYKIERTKSKTSKDDQETDRQGSDNNFFLKANRVLGLSVLYKKIFDISPQLFCYTLWINLSRHCVIIFDMF